jgi:hypothetical protein
VGTDAGALVASAARLRWRAPELALLMADQASAAAAQAGAEPVRLRAEVLAVFASNQLGRGAEAGGRAVRALRAAQLAGEETTERLIRVELAAGAADAAAPAAGLAVLLPVFDRLSLAAPATGAVQAALAARAAPTARAAAMVTAADCLARLGGGPEVAVLLAQADRLYDTSRSVEPGAVLLRRGVVHARLAAYHRRRGDYRSAESTARTGLALVDRLAGDERATGHVTGALTLELVFALLDSARMPEAVLAAQPVLRRPARPAGALAACWLRLGLTSRVHMPAGRYALARRLLGEAAADAERNRLDAALAECRQLQAQLHETCAELGEALHSVRAAHIAERRWRDTAAELRTTLAAEFGPPAPVAELRSALTDVLAVMRSTEASAPLGRGGPAHPSRFRQAAPAPPRAQAAEAAAAGHEPVAAESVAAELVAAEPVAAAARSEVTSAAMEAGEGGSSASDASQQPETGPPARPEALAAADVSAVAPPVPPVEWPPPSEPHSEPATGQERPPSPEPAPAVASGPPAEAAVAEAAVDTDSVGRPAMNGFDRGSGRHRSDVAMADLLAEALLAYQNGQRSRLAGEATTAPAAPRPQPAEPPTEPSKSHVRLVDLPPELVWREPGWERRR